MTLTVYMKDKTFKYTFLALSDSSAFGNGITRHSETATPASRDAFATHIFPFATLPQLTSHVHPTFVIMHLASIIFNNSNAFLRSLTDSNRVVCKVASLYSGWAKGAPSWAVTEPSFVKAPKFYEEGVEVLEEVEFDSELLEGDGTCTPPYRIYYPPTIVCQPPPYPRENIPIDDSDDTGEDVVSAEDFTLRS